MYKANVFSFVPIYVVEEKNSNKSYKMHADARHKPISVYSLLLALDTVLRFVHMFHTQCAVVLNTISSLLKKT